MDNELRDDVISAALDGERVDVEALRRALATAEGRESLAAFVLLRAAAADDDVVPSKRWEDLAVVAKPRPRPWLLVGPRVSAAWAASIAILAIAASFWFGTTLRAPTSTLTLIAPPAAPMTTLAPPIIAVPTNAVSEDRLPGPRSHAADISRLRHAEPPRPTRVLQFVPGVDWISAPE